jgi:hypothetical protein
MRLLSPSSTADGRIPFLGWQGLQLPRRDTSFWVSCAFTLSYYNGSWSAPLPGWILRMRYPTHAILSVPADLRDFDLDIDSVDPSFYPWLVD